MKNVGLALQGGGSHGAFTWGVLDRLLELKQEDLNVLSVCGTSAGAINAVVMAYGLHVGGRLKARELLEKFWTDVSRYGFKMSYPFVEYFTQVVSPYQFNPLNYNPLRSIVSDIVDFEVLRECGMDLHIYATNVKTNQGKLFSRDEITLDSVMASTALPTMFQAVRIGDDYYWDGGYMGNPPLSPLAMDKRLTDLILVKLNSININYLPTNAKDINDRVTEICFNSSLMNEMKIIQLRNELIRQGLDLGKYGSKEIFVHLISGYETLGKLNYSTKMSTDLNFLPKLKNAGRRTADKWLQSDFKKLGVQSTFDVERDFFNRY